MREKKLREKLREKWKGEGGLYKELWGQRERRSSRGVGPQETALSREKWGKGVALNGEDREGGREGEK